MASGPVTVTTAAQFIPEIWSGQTLDFREANLVTAKRVDRSFERDAKYGNKVDVPNITELSARNKTAATDITYEAITEVKTQIVINTHQYAAIKVEDIVKIQSMYDLQAKYSSQFGYVLAKAVDTVLNALVAGFSQTVGTLAVAMTDENIRTAIQKLNDANAPMQDRAFIVSPAEMNNLMALDRLTNRDYALGQTGGQGGTMLTSIYGIPVDMTTNMTSDSSGHDNVLLHKSALALVMQMGVTSEAEYSVDSLAWKIVSHEIYGTLEMRDNHGVWLKAA